MKLLITFLILLTALNVPAQTIVCPRDALPNVKLAAKEVRRYVYLRTGKLLPVAETGKGIRLTIDPALAAPEYRITANTIIGGSDVGVLYGAYRYAENLGVRFEIDGDVIPDEPLKELLVVNDAGKPLPKEYQGQPRLIVPCVRSVVNKNEELKLKITALPATRPTVHVRPLGKGRWQTMPATHVARAVYEVKLPAAQDDFEYYITAGKTLVWPATAPQINQTVVVIEDELRLNTAQTDGVSDNKQE